MVCTKTLYNYVNTGLIGIKNIDLPEKLRRKPNAHRNRKNKRVLGRSIEERPASIDSRKDFGHWDTDLIIGSHSGEDDVLLTLIERKTRNLMVFRLPDKSVESVMTAFNALRREYSNCFTSIILCIQLTNLLFSAAE